MFDARNPSPGFEYTWCQVLSNEEFSDSIGAEGTKEHFVDALDGDFPYPHPKTTQVHAEDEPGISNIGDPENMKDKAFFDITGTMWYMCKPMGITGIWVPLYSYTWNLSFGLKAVKKGGDYVWVVVNPVYPNNNNFTTTVRFPSWSEIKPAN
jgi:hypothetical protein